MMISVEEEGDEGKRGGGRRETKGRGEGGGGGETEGGEGDKGRPGREIGVEGGGKREKERETRGGSRGEGRGNKFVIDITSLRSLSRPLTKMEEPLC